jgi:tight adherence protein B
MPELARTLSNATSAGLSVRTALAMAVDELADPARSEIRLVTEQLNLGASLDGALTNMERRLPSREAAILISTLIVSARSGGGLVTALRDIAGTLETRKETRREIRTVYAQAVATAYAVLLMGVGVLFLLDSVHEGTVDTMLREPLGQVALMVAGGIYAAGILVIRRMTRVEV